MHGLHMHLQVGSFFDIKILKKANFVSRTCAAAPDTIYDKTYAVDWAIEQFDILFPKLKQVEKKVKLFFETEVGEKTIN